MLISKGISLSGDFAYYLHRLKPWRDGEKNRRTFSYHPYKRTFLHSSDFGLKVPDRAKREASESSSIVSRISSYIFDFSARGPYSLRHELVRAFEDACSESLFIVVVFEDRAEKRLRKSMSCGSDCGLKRGKMEASKWRPLRGKKRARV